MTGVAFKRNGLTCEPAFCVNMNAVILFKLSRGCRGDTVDFLGPF
jgi:hypothetical protein